MGLTVTLAGDWLSNIGNRRAIEGTITFDSSYPTGGESLTAANIGLGVLKRIQFNPVSGYILTYDYANQKVLVYAAGGAALPSVVVTGGQSAGEALQITPDSNSGVLGKVAATTRTIPGATFGLVASGGAAGEVANLTNLSTLVVEFWAEGL